MLAMKHKQSVDFCGYWRRAYPKDIMDAEVVGDGITNPESQPNLSWGHLEKFLSPSRHESDSMTVRGHGRMERAGHGAEGLFRC
jgi:hypothetical protein